MTNYDILFVDDEKSIRQLIEIYLPSVNKTVMLAENGKEALDTLKDNKFRLIFSDINMPVMDAFGFMKAYMAQYGSNNDVAPVQFGSGNPLQKGIETLIEQSQTILDSRGIPMKAELLIKPYNFKSLNETFDAYFSHV